MARSPMPSPVPPETGGVRLVLVTAWNFLGDALKALLRPSLRRDAFMSVFLTSILGTLVLLYAIAELDQQSELAGLVNSAGRLRMLSQRATYMAHRAAQGDADAQAVLVKLHDDLESDLRYVEAHGDSTGLFQDDENRRKFIALQTLWTEYRSLISRTGPPGAGPGVPPDAVRKIEVEGEALLSAANTMVDSVLVRFVEKRERLRSLVPFALACGLLLSLSTLIYNYFRIQKPLHAIGNLFDRIAEGDFSFRGVAPRKDEFGQLVDRLNRDADIIQHLREDQARAEQAIRDSELRNRTLWEVSADAIIMIDAQGTIRHANPAVARIFGYGPEEILGRDISLLQPADLRERHRVAFARYVTTRKRRHGWAGLELNIQHKDGRLIPSELSFAHMVLSGEDWFVGFFRDISQRVEAVAHLRMLKSAIDSTGEGVMITDAQATDHPIIYINPALERITGYGAEELLGHSGWSLLEKAGDPAEAATLRRLLQESRAGAIQFHGRRKDGEAYWVDLSVAPVRLGKGDVGHHVSIFKDISGQKQQEAELLRSANYDALTGLPNRTLLYDRLRQAIMAGQRHRREIGILFIDLDHFKVINDSLGHEVGDQLLLSVADALKDCLREGDTVARWGGDEFVVLLPELDLRDDIMVIAQRVLDLLNRPIQLGEQRVYCSASIGGSVYPRDGDSPDALLQHADIAMYRAKGQGRNSYRSYAREMKHDVNRRLTIETQLRSAVEKGELSLHFQPQIELASGRVVGAEALMRWHHPELGSVSPAMFIPVAEESGLILTIGEWALHTACAEARRWQEIGLGEICMAINFSARQFSQADLPAWLNSILQCHGLAAGDIEVEITENLVMTSPAKTAETLRQLHALGIRTALDDFGTGYSSLAYLKNFPVNRLKIDKSFVKDQAIVRAIIQLALSYDLETVAEGVEDEETLSMLAGLGCDIVQGYYYSRPLPADEFVRYARERRIVIEASQEKCS